MLRKYTNALLQEIVRAGYRPTMFASKEENNQREYSGVEISLKGSPLWFALRNPHGSFDQFFYQYVEFAAGFPWTEERPEGGYAGFEEVLPAFREWLATDVRDHLEDQALPDLWDQAARGQDVFSPGAITSFGDSFSVEEKAQVRIAAEQLKLLIAKEFDASAEEMAVVHKQLEHLSEAVERLGRFDWQGVALNTLISIGITLSLDTQKGQILLGLFRQAFSYALHLLK